jgi:hypothetical protein
MISDEPDEDADTLDDETLLATYAGADPGTGCRTAADVREWPASHRPSVAEADIDAATLAWFKANHADWQGELRIVLRTWVAQQSWPLPDTRPPA